MTTVSSRITLTFVNQTYYIKLLTAVDLDVAGVRSFKYLENKKLKYKLFYIIIRIK